MYHCMTNKPPRLPLSIKVLLLLLLLLLLLIICLVKLPLQYAYPLLYYFVYPSPCALCACLHPAFILPSLPCVQAMLIKAYFKLRAVWGQKGRACKWSAPGGESNSLCNTTFYCTLDLYDEYVGCEKVCVMG